MSFEELVDKLNPRRYEPLETEKILVTDKEIRMQLKGYDSGLLLEAALIVHRERSTNELSLDIVRHFTDPESVPWWDTSSPWPF